MHPAQLLIGLLALLIGAFLVTLKFAKNRILKTTVSIICLIIIIWVLVIIFSSRVIASIPADIRGEIIPGLSLTRYASAQSKLGDWVTNPSNGHAYKFVSNVGNWHAAKAAAEKEGAHLVTISDASEQSWITSQFAGFDDAWIGFTDESREGVWVWITGEPVTFLNWGKGEPNNETSGEDYGVIISTNSRILSYYGGAVGVWNDWWFDAVTNAIFEKEPSTSLTEASRAPATPTPEPTPTSAVGFSCSKPAQASQGDNGVDISLIFGGIGLFAMMLKSRRRPQ